VPAVYFATDVVIPEFNTHPFRNLAIASLDQITWSSVNFIALITKMIKFHQPLIATCAENVIGGNFEDCLVYPDNNLICSCGVCERHPKPR